MRKQFIVALTIAVASMLIGVGMTGIVYTLDEEDNYEKECEHWIFNYHYRGRMNTEVLCGTDTVLSKVGRYKPLPPHLQKLQEDIDEEFGILQQRLKQAKKYNEYPR